MTENFFTELFINSQWVNTVRRIKVFNPATNEVVAEVAHAEKEHIEAALCSADAAFKLWKHSSAKVRCNVLMKWYHLILEHQQQLAKIVTLECGKPLKEAVGEVVYAASFVEWAAEQAKRIDGYIINSPLPQTEINVMYEPVGVVGAITPWNFPAAMITRKIAPAIAAGCAVVLKPAETTPLTALYLAYLSVLAGFPSGLINMIMGDPEQIGESLTSDERIRKITFTGSTRVGKILYASSAATVKKVSLELGGNAPFIVFADADLDAAANGLILCKFRNAGQTCVCANRVLVQQAVYEEFALKLKALVAKLKVGNGLDADTTLGPLINQAGKRKVLNHVNDALANGASLYYGGNDLAGNFVEPTILTNVTEKALISHEETFGPVAALFAFATEEDAVRMANNTKFGLAAYFYTTDYQRIWRVKQQLEYGMIGINSGTISVENAPFGGIKESGVGVEGGQLGIYEFVETKYTMNKF